MVREVLRTTVAVLLFATLMSVLTVTARGAADPPPLVIPDPPRIEQRVSTLEREVAALKRKVADLEKTETITHETGPGVIGTKPVTFPLKPVVQSTPHYETVPTVSQSRAAGGHTHTCANGHTWDHSMDGGSHRCPVCGLSQYVVDSEKSSTTYYGVQSSGCSGAGCSTGLQYQSSGWRPGKRLGR